MDEYEVEFLRLSRYARALVVTEYNKSVRFQESLRYDMRVLITPQRERIFVVLVDKAKIMKEIKRIECKRRGSKERLGQGKMDSYPSDSI